MMPILQTKFFVPSCPDGLISRPRLLQQIRLDKRLTLVSAPAGFGKTTFIAQWMAGVYDGVYDGLRCWLSLEAADNDMTRFFSYLISALQTAHTQIGVGVLSNLKNGLVPDSILTMIINDIIQIDAQIVLVLDDYHAIENEQIHQAMTFLLEHLPPNLHLILVTRVDPPSPLPLAKLRVQQRLTEIRAIDLRFRMHETQQFLINQTQIELSNEDINQLDQHTDGWVAGLQLAALALQSSNQSYGDVIRTFSGSDRYVMDYVINDVLEQLPPAVRTFLVETAILKRLCAPLCNAVRQTDDSQEILQKVEQANLFLFPLDNRRHWYRYHPLFADSLRHYYALQGGSVTTFHHRASIWYEQNQFIEEAVAHAFSAQDGARAASLVEQYAHPFFSDGKIMTVCQWLDQLTPDLIYDRPKLYLIYGLVLYRTGNIERLILHLQRPPTPLSDPEQGELLSLRAYKAYWQGDFVSAIQLVQDAVALLDVNDFAVRMPTFTLMGWCQEAQGDLLAAVDTHHTVWQMAHATDSLMGMVGSCGKLTMLYAKMGQPNTATRYYKQITTVMEQCGASDIILSGLVYIAAGQLYFDDKKIEKGIALCQQWGGLYIEAIRGYGVLLSVLQEQGQAEQVMTKRLEAQEFAYRHRLSDWVLTLLDPSTALSSIDPLTAREQEVLTWLAKGLSVPQIAEELVVGVNTIRTHVKHIYSKLNTHSRHEALQMARKHNLLT
ncbi:MAG: LuxR C-terminal-related transcriptional regulator [Chloroflexota bacterium]